MFLRFIHIVGCDRFPSFLRPDNKYSIVCMYSPHFVYVVFLWKASKFVLTSSWIAGGSFGFCQALFCSCWLACTTSGLTYSAVGPAGGHLGDNFHNHALCLCSLALSQGPTVRSHAVFWTSLSMQLCCQLPCPSDSSPRSTAERGSLPLCLGRLLLCLGFMFLLSDRKWSW